mgnify:CR=1 FL=1
MNLTDMEKSQLRSILQTPQWRTFERIAELLIAKIKDDSALRETNEATLREFLLQEGKIQGIRQFFQELVTISHEHTNPTSNRRQSEI